MTGNKDKYLEFLKYLHMQKIIRTLIIMLSI